MTDTTKPRLVTCPKCGMRAIAFVCSEPGCPVNGGAYYGPAPERPEPSAPSEEAVDEIDMACGEVVERIMGWEHIIHPLVRQRLAARIDAFAARAVAAEREAWISLVAEHLSGRFLNVRAFIAAVSRRGEP